MTNDPIVIRAYQPNDEHAILAAFNATFHVQRSLAHWQWKYLNNPYGQTWIAAAWEQDKVVAHYAGVPVPLYMENKTQLTCQGLDVFTVPSHRKVGHGGSSLMSRTFYQWEQHSKNRVSFAFGFNRHSAQKLGKLFWQHEVLAPVYQHKLLCSDVKPAKFAWLDTLRGYRVVKTAVVGEWADELFARVKDSYGWLVQRDQAYLDWRYAQQPDFPHEFYVVYRRNKVIGWIVGRHKDDKWLWGDALFDPAYVHKALPLVLHKLMGTHTQLTEVDSWFAEVPQWWNVAISKQGFVKQRQFQMLDIIAKFYLAPVAATCGDKFYFTWGDSDLF